MDWLAVVGGAESYWEVWLVIMGGRGLLRLLD